MRKRALLLTLLITACTGQTATSEPAISGGSPTSAERAGGATAVPTQDLSPTKVGFTCQLPTVEISTDGGTYIYRPGFVSFPSATFALDPSGGLVWESARQDYATMSTPTLHGLPQGGPPFFDAALRRWVPATAAQSNPGGTAYAYVNATIGQNLSVHVVDAVTGTERVFPTGTNFGLGVADFAPEGIYLVQGSAIGGPGTAVYLMNPVTGAIKPLNPTLGVMGVRGGYAWIAATGPAQPGVEVLSVVGIKRLDLATGVTTEWFETPNSNVVLWGFDSHGLPVVEVDVNAMSYGRGEFFLLQQPQKPVLISEGGIELSGPQGDGDRLWFGTAQGIWLFTPTTGLERVFPYEGNSQLHESIAPVGFCR